MLLRKGVYPYEYMDSCEIFDETSLAVKKAFYGNLNMKGIKEVDYRHDMQKKKKKKLKSLILKFYVSIMIFMIKVTHYCLQMYLKIL